MGNKVNITLNTNSTNGTKTGRTGDDRIPMQRGAQETQAVDAQLGFVIVLIVASIAMNIFMIILMQKKFKTLPYIMLQNIVVADLVTPIVNGPLFFLGLMLDQNGIFLPNICNVQGFLHAALSAVFLNTVFMIAVSRCLAILKPDLYHKIFCNKINLRLLSLGLWSTSALVCVPPLNFKGWGGYQRLEATCWLAWKPDNNDYMAYNFLVTIVTLCPAVVSSVFALKAVYSVRKIDAVAPQGPPPPYPGTFQESNNLPQKVTQTVHYNTEVLLITTSQLITYLLLWIPLTVMDWAFIKDWRTVDYRAVIAFIFLFLGRSLFNPLIYFVVSSDIRQRFIDLFCRCKCSSSNIEENHVEL